MTSLAASDCAFAALRMDGSAVAWGDPVLGGSCEHVDDELVEARSEHEVVCVCGFRYASCTLDPKNPKTLNS